MEEEGALRLSLYGGLVVLVALVLAFVAVALTLQS